MMDHELLWDTPHENFEYEPNGLRRRKKNLREWRNHENSMIRLQEEEGTKRNRIGWSRARRVRADGNTCFNRQIIVVSRAATAESLKISYFGRDGL